MQTRFFISPVTVLILICTFLVAGLARTTTPTAEAQVRLPCGQAAFAINETLPNGSRWSLCWEERQKEGVILRAIRYATPGGELRSVLFQANIAQIFVPYDSNQARFHDLSDYGLGGSNLNNMSTADCPSGVLMQNNGRNILCKKVVPQGYAYKYYSSQKQSDALVLFSVSHIGAYNYISQWVFYDDGTIEPGIGATGKLQLYTSDPRYGWPLNRTNTSLGTSHVHNYYWRLDFDIVTPQSNAVQEMEFLNEGAATRTIKLTSIPNERAIQASPNTFRSWRILNTALTNDDGHQVSYELLPQSSHIFRGPATEPWTFNDMFITQHRDCELAATHNGNMPGGCGDNVAQFVNNEALVDPVVWYGMTFHHLARDEDQEMMSTHWSSFQVVPRDMNAVQTR